MVLIINFIPIVNKNLDKVLKGISSNNLEVLQETPTMIVLLIVAFISLFFLSSMFYYLFIGFKTVTNMKSTKQVLPFIAVVLFIIVSTSILSLLIPLKI